MRHAIKSPILPRELGVSARIRRPSRAGYRFIRGLDLRASPGGVFVGGGSDDGECHDNEVHAPLFNFPENAPC